MANKFQVKRTTTSGLLPNTTNSGNSSYIAAGELAVNLTDKKMVSSNGSVTFEIGANLVNLSVTNVATVSNKLSVGNAAGYDFGSLALIEGDGNQNGYLQVVIQNANTGEFSTSDFIAVADNGTDTVNYADFGINGSNYSQPEFGLSQPYDAYVYSSNGNVTIGSLSAKDIIFHTGGSNAVHERVRFTNGGTLRVGNSTTNTSITPTAIVTTDITTTNLEVTDTATINTNSITIGNSSINTIISADELDLGGWVIANGSIGSAGQVLKSGGSGANVYWATVTGGSGSPGGTDTQVQFNDASSFGGDSGLTYNKTTDALTVAGSVLVGANVVANTSALLIGNSSVNTVITSTTITGNNITANSVVFGTVNATSINVGANVTLNTSAIAVGANVLANSTTLFLGNSSVNTYITQNLLTLGGQVNANGSVGSNGYVLTSSASGNAYWFSVLEPVGAITHDMTGHLNTTDSTITVNNSTRTVTWTPDTTSVVYYRGKPLSISSAKSYTFADTDGGHYINLNPDTLALYDAGATGGIRDNILVAYVYWDATNNEAIILGDERHGANRDVEWHYSNHRNVGAVWRSGGGLTYTLNDDTAVSVAVGSPVLLADEDLEHSIEHAASPNGYYQQILTTAASLPVIYRNGTSYSQVAGSTTPWLFGTSRAQYNSLSGNSGSLVDASEGHYISYWMIATNDMQNPIKLVIGNFSHATLDAALAESIADIGLYFAEMAVMYQIIVQTSTTFTGNAKRVKIAQVRQVVASSISRETISAASHTELSGRNEADQHPTSAITGLDTILNGLGTISTQNANNVTITGGTANLSTVTLGANVFANTTTVFTGNSTVNATHNSSLIQVSNSTSTANLTAAGVSIGTIVANTTGLFVGSNVFANSSAFDVGNTTVASTLLTLGGQVNANGGVGSSGQVLTSGAAGNAYWTTPLAIGGSNTQIQFNDSGALGGSAGLTFDKSTNNITLANTLTVSTGTILVGNATVNTSISNTDISKNGVSVVPFGKQTIWVPASAMYATTTAGAASGTVELATNKEMLRTFDFDTTTQEFVQFAIQMPKSWDEGTVIVQFVWSHAATTVNFGVAWAAQGVAFSDNQAIDTAFGTEQVATDTGGTTNNLYISPETAAITIGNTPAAEDWVVFQIKRVPANGSDTMAIDARLHGVKIHYTINAATDN